MHPPIGASERARYEVDGIVVVSQLFSADEVESYVNHFMRLRAAGGYPGDQVISAPIDDDPLRRYPRMMQMHRWDDVSLRWLLDERLRACLAMLLGEEPYAVQTSLYFKPPGSRGQALHQDNYFVRARPGTCVAAWLALDDCDEANGCLQIVLGSHEWPILCTVKADTTQSFTDRTVPLPAGSVVKALAMAAGDVAFFNGVLVHGSFSNTTADRFRRSLIGHYVTGDAQQVGRWYQPTLRMDGTPIELGISPRSTTCGRWVTRDGQPVPEESYLEVVDSDGRP